MKKLIVIVFFVFSACSELPEYVISKNEIKEMAEKVYFEAQKDALNGEWKIKYDKDSCLIWKTSPWDSNEKPIFQPYFCK